MFTHRRRHRRGILEEARKDAAVRRDDRVGRVKHIERRCPIVGVDDDFHAVPRVVNGIAAETVVARVRIAA